LRKHGFSAECRLGRLTNEEDAAAYFRTQKMGNHKTSRQKRRGAYPQASAEGGSMRGAYLPRVLPSYISVNMLTIR
jgi:hypothetical protein